MLSASGGIIPQRKGYVNRNFPKRHKISAVFYFNLLVQFYSCTDIKKWLNNAGFCKFALRQINESYRKELLYTIIFLLYLISFPKSYGI